MLADAHGNAIHLGERDCTIQRRHQKLVEETPSPAVSAELRERIGADRRRRGPGGRLPGRRHDRGPPRRGRELLLPRDEHADPGRAHDHRARDRDRPRPRAGARRGRRAARLSARTTSSSAATRSSAGSTPRTRRAASSRRPGTITAYREPAGPGVRVDSGVEAGSEVVGIYDPMIAKLCVWDTDRERARRRMLRALEEYVVEGVTDADRVPPGAARASVLRRGRRRATGSSSRRSWPSRRAASSRRTAHDGRAPAAGRDAGPHRSRVELDGRRFEVTRARARASARRARPAAARARGRARCGPHAAAKEAVVSPMQGTVLSVEVADGDEVEAGRVICVVEAMKMENEIRAHRDGVVTGLTVAPGEAVETGPGHLRRVRERRRAAGLTPRVSRHRTEAAGRGPSAPRRRPSAASRSTRRRAGSTLDRRRVPASLEPRPPRGERALRRGEGAPPRAARPRCPARGSSSSSGPSRSGADAPRRPRLLRADSADGAARSSGSSPTPTTSCAGSTSRARCAGGAPVGARSSIRCSSSARTGSATAAARSTAARSTTRCAATESAGAGRGSPRTSAATASPGTSSRSPTGSTSGGSARRRAGGRRRARRRADPARSSYRGRSAYGFAAQAGERRVREETGLRGIADLRLASATEAAAGTWALRFEEEPAGRAHEVESSRSRSPPSRPSSRARPPSPAARRRYVATEYRTA